MPEQTKIICLYDNHAFSEAIEYTFHLLLIGYGVSCKAVPLNRFNPDEYDFNRVLVVSYGKQFINTDFVRQIHIYASDFFGQDYLKPSSMPSTTLKRYEGLPVIYSGHGEIDNLVRHSGNIIETNIDIIASSFFMVSRYEEIIANTRDKYGRFPASASLAYRESFLDRPIVNEYMELLRNWVKILMPDLSVKPFWPDNKEFVFCLTHDVDSIKRYSLRPPLMRAASAILQKKSPRLALSIGVEYPLVLSRIKKDPHDTFDYMLDLERIHRIKSSFYFMSGEGSAPAAYSITEPDTVALIRRLEENGCEVGLHASYDSYSKLDIMTREKECLDSLVRNPKYGCRQHVLCWKTPDTWRIQEQLGIFYDTSMSYADHIGFRCAICLPFQPFDVIENRRLDIWELPLMVMEGSLQNPGYQNLLPDEACCEIIRHIDIVREYNGVFVLLWHNSSFDSLGGWKGWREVYEEVLDYIDGKNAMNCSGREIIEYWKNITQV